MADEQSGQDQTQNDQQEEQTSQQNEQQESAYKVFETEDDYKQAQDKFFRGAYNEGKQKMFKDTVQTAQQKLGIEGDFESVEDVFDQAASRLNGSGDSDGDSQAENKEAEELRKRLEEMQNQLEQKETQIREKEIDGTLNSALNQVKQENNVQLKDEHLKMLFRNEHEIKMDDEGNKFVQRSDGTPVLDGDGNREDVANVLQRFVKENKYAQPKAEGLGGGTGSGATGEKPKFSTFKELMNSNKQDDRQKAFDLRQKAQDVGWADGDSPQDAMKWNK